MTPIEDVYAVEVAKWDALAKERGARPGRLWVRDADFHAYARRCRTTAGMSEFVGDLRDREVLELGCGFGAVTTLLARSGAHVTALDISRGSVEVARRRAELHGVE